MNVLPPLDRYHGLLPFINDWEKGQAEFLGSLLYETLCPVRVIDWGCASGLYLLPFESRGCAIYGLDGEPQSGKLIPGRFYQCDFRLPIKLSYHYDLALCIEVGEHLQAEYADQLVENVANSANTVFWSAAGPGQGGLYHYNEQPRQYWFNKFNAQGFALHSKQDYILEQIRGNPECQKVQWLLNNTLVLSNGSKST